MTDNITRYTDAVLAEVFEHFQDMPADPKRKKNFLPVLHSIYLKVQAANAGIKADFTDAEKIYDTFTNYVRLIAEVNKLTELVPTRVNFCAFLGINTEMYGRMLQNASGDVRDALWYVEDYFVSLLQTSSLNGDIGSNAAKLVMQTAGRYGHGIVTAKEAADIRKSEQALSPAELEAKLKQIMAGGK